MATPQIEAIVIGGSAGALDALLTMLPDMRADFPIPIAIVLHLLPGKPSFAAQLFGAKCRLAVKEAEDKEPFLPGTVYALWRHEEFRSRSTLHARSFAPHE